MTKKMFTFLMIALVGFILTLNFTGCKKDKAQDAPGVEESSEEDVAEDEEAMEE